jgi:hypothetical protein
MAHWLARCAKYTLEEKVECIHKRQTHLLVREGAPIEQDSNFHIRRRRRRRRRKSGHGPQEGARYQDLLTD